MHIDRRTFIRSAAGAAAVGMLSPGEGFTAPDGRAKIYVVHGDDPAKMLALGLERLGGLKKRIPQGAKAVLKVNAAWASYPDQGGNTHPDLAGACVRALLEAGAASVIVPENTCSPPEQSFKMSGIKKAVTAAGGKLYAATEAGQFRKIAVTKGKILKEAEVVTDILDARFLVNMPVAKSHGSCTVTASLKNWMGSVKDRRLWHREGVHQCIADLNTAVRADLIVLDATRIMLTEGPRGPGEMAHPKQIVLGTDPVAVDAYAATLFKKKPFDIEHIKLAHAMGIGTGDLKKIEVIHVNKA